MRTVQVDIPTRIVDLTENTIKDNSRFFDNIEDVPTRRIHDGIIKYHESEKIYLVRRKT